MQNETAEIILVLALGLEGEISHPLKSFFLETSGWYRVFLLKGSSNAMKSQFRFPIPL